MCSSEWMTDKVSLPICQYTSIEEEIACQSDTDTWYLCSHLSPVSTTRVHGPSWRPVNSGAFFDTHQLGPSTRVSKNAPELMGHQLGPSTRAVNSGSGNWALGNVHTAVQHNVLQPSVTSALTYNSAQFTWHQYTSDNVCKLLYTFVHHKSGTVHKTDNTRQSPDCRHVEYCI